MLVGDDHSQDSTYLVGLGYQQTATDLPLTIVRHPENLGYGGNQKWGYQYAIEHGLGRRGAPARRRAVRPRAAGQPWSSRSSTGRAEAVFGSRMLHRGEARRGGMPAYKYVGNRILTTMQNAVVGTDAVRVALGLPGLRRARAWPRCPSTDNSDGFDFDTEIIIQLHEAKLRIAEVPIPTYYGDEICYVDGMKYAKDVTRDVLRYRAHKMGFGTGELAFASDRLRAEGGRGHLPRPDPGAGWSRGPPSRVLDLGCSDGELGRPARGHGPRGRRGRLTRSTRACASRSPTSSRPTSTQGIPEDVGDGFDVVLAADVLEHVRHPERAPRRRPRACCAGRHA